MIDVTFDLERCTKCGTCVRTCPEEVFEQTQEGAVPEVVNADLCISCGHCAAICPHDALHHSNFPEGTITPLDLDKLPSYDQLIEFLRSRRSIRAFEDEPVERADIERVLEAARLAPSAHNKQSTQIIVVQDKVLLRQITELTVDFFTKTARQIRSRVMGQIMRIVAKDEIDDAIDLLVDFDLLKNGLANGKDLVLYNAPCLIVFHDRPGANFPDVCANLCLHNATLAAHALCLGSFYTGFVVGACHRDKRIPRLLDLPPRHRIYAAMALGHPSHRFTKGIQPRPRDATWH